jgi:predicted nucleotidyltransferase
MPTVMSMHWPEVTKEKYEAARKEVDWEGQTPAGAKLHISWFADDGFHVIDLWDSVADFQKFAAERLMPGVQKIGVDGQPRVELSEAHAIFAPNV